MTTPIPRAGEAPRLPTQPLMRRLHRSLAPIALAAGLAVVAAPPAGAAAFTVNFDDQGLTGPSFFPDDADPALQVTLAPGVTVTFSGGSILTATNGLTTNQTSVYGTAAFDQQTPIFGYENPISISFSVPVFDLAFEVFNGTSFAMFEAVFGGETQSFTFPATLDAHRFTFAGLGQLQTLELLSPPVNYSYFVDNFSFRIPAPAGALVLATALLALAGLRLRR